MWKLVPTPRSDFISIVASSISHRRFTIDKPIPSPGSPSMNEAQCRRLRSSRECLQRCVRPALLRSSCASVLCLTSSASASGSPRIGMKARAGVSNAQHPALGITGVALPPRYRDTTLACVFHGV